MPEKMPFRDIVVIGGGSGASTLANGFANALPDAYVTSLVTTSDSGGSTGILRSSFSTLAVGDARKNIAALCPHPQATAILERRYGPADSISDVDMDSDLLATYTGSDMTENARDIAKQLEGIAGHTYGNFVLTALAKRSTLYDGLQQLGAALGLRGQVVPITEDPHELQMHDAGSIIIGEHEIDSRYIHDSRSARVSLTPDAQLHPAAHEAITQADAVFIAPGSIFTSLGAALSAKGAVDAFHSMRGKLIQVANLATQEHETSGWEVTDYVEAVADYTNRYPDYIFYNNAPLPNGETLIPFDGKKLAQLAPHVKAIGQPLVHQQVRIKDPNDQTTRSALIHNIQPIARFFRPSVFA